jgi:PTS system nitrogen regulatory IIA component
MEYTIMFDKRPLGELETSRQVATFTDVLVRDRAIILTSEHKHDVLEEMAGALATAPEVTDGEELLSALQAREQLMSTGIGLHLAVPHVRLKSVSDLVMAVGLAPHGIRDYESIDGLPVYVVFAMAGAASQHTEYIQMLSLVSRVMKDADKRKHILSAPTAQDLFDRVIEAGEA